MEGWRLAFLSLSAVGLAAGAANYFWTADPLQAGWDPDALRDDGRCHRQRPSVAKKGGGWRQQALAGLLAEVGQVCRIRTFQIIVAQVSPLSLQPAGCRLPLSSTGRPCLGCVALLQGICGSIPWVALVFLTLYLQLIGMSDANASGLVATFLLCTAFGGLMGGWIGDVAAARNPQHGRIAVTQVWQGNLCQPGGRHVCSHC